MHAPVTMTQKISVEPNLEYSSKKFDDLFYNDKVFSSLANYLTFFFQCSIHKLLLVKNSR